MMAVLRFPRMTCATLGAVFPWFPEARRRIHVPKGMNGMSFVLHGRQFEDETRAFSRALTNLIALSVGGCVISP